jgi:hypothetical protein
MRQTNLKLPKSAISSSISFAILIAMSFAISMGSIAQSQSLADAARMNREKQKAKEASSPAKPRVITNDNLPSNSDPGSGGMQSEEKTWAQSPKSPSRTRPAGQLSAAQWKSKIQAQKAAVATLQSQIAKQNESIHFVTAGLFTNGVQYNQQQAKKQQNVELMQHQLEEQKKVLANMQESARRAGMGSAVYDP